MKRQRLHVNQHFIYCDKIQIYKKRISRQISCSTLLLAGKQMIYLIEDLLFAGTETTTNTLTWSIIYLLHHPDVMVKVKEEINKVPGKNKKASMIDKQKMPYVEATIMEIQRIADIIPLAVHSVLEDVEFRGYTIPKGTIVVPNLHAVHTDERIWEEPDAFKPSRFSDSKGQIVRRSELIPFGIGKLKHITVGTVL